MNTLSRKQRTKLSRELKEYAFDESPQFAENSVQAMEMSRTFELYDLEAQEDDLYNKTVIEIGFRAVRYTLGNTSTEYIFNLHCYAERRLPAEELQLDEDEWYRIDEMYEWDEEDEEDEVEADEPLDTACIIEALNEEGCACVQYERLKYLYDTEDGAVRFSNERGYKIDGKYYGVSETHPVNLAYRSLPPVDRLDKDSSGDEIMTQILFDEVTAELQDEFKKNGDIMPSSEKIKEIRYLVECLRQRRIDI